MPGNHCAPGITGGRAPLAGGARSAPSKKSDDRAPEPVESAPTSATSRRRSRTPARASRRATARSATASWNASAPPTASTAASGYRSRDAVCAIHTRRAVPRAEIFIRWSRRSPGPWCRCRPEGCRGPAGVPGQESEPEPPPVPRSRIGRPTDGEAHVRRRRRTPPGGSGSRATGFARPPALASAAAVTARHGDTLCARSSALRKRRPLALRRCHRPRGHAGRSARQPDQDPQPAGRRGAQGHRAAVGLGDRSHDRQSQAEALDRAMEPPERLGQQLRLLRVDRLAAVADLEQRRGRPGPRC